MQNFSCFCYNLAKMNKNLGKRAVGGKSNVTQSLLQVYQLIGSCIQLKLLGVNFGKGVGGVGFMLAEGSVRWACWVSTC